jgi:hypothetical protein
MTFFGPDIRNGVPVGLGSTAAFGRRGFTPASLFAQGQAGVWYDPSDLGTMFTTSDGTTPVTAVEQAVGLILDKSRGLAIGAELVTNGSFSSDTAWTKVNTTITGGNAVWSAAAIDSYVLQTIGFVTGRSYRVEIVVDSYSAGTLLARFGGAATDTNLNISGPGTYSVIGTATATTFLLRSGSASNTFAISSVSVREISGTHAIQPSAASRPILRNRYNQFTYSEQFNDAAWVKNTSSITATNGTDPLGGSTADRWVSNVGSTTHYLGQSIGATNGQSFTIAMWVKSATGSNQTFTLFVGSSIGSTTFTATPDWQRFTFTGAVTTTASLIFGISRDSSNNAVDLWVWGADLRAAPDTIYPYQRIEAATVYDSDATKFPLYLAFDGSDDSLYTAANLDLSATDKVSVFAGVTKLSDAANGVVMETSADSTTNNGAWWVLAPYPLNYYSMLSRGTAFQIASSTNAADAAPNTAVVTGTGDISGDRAILRVNGAQRQETTSDQGTGNYGSYPLYIGRRNNASLPYNGRIQQLIVRGAASSAAEISSAERWVAGKQGRAL